MLFSNTNIPYTYLIGWSKLNLNYYGRRTAHDCHPDEFWITYFTSSDYVAEARLLYGEPDIKQIRQTFSGEDRIERCVAWEKRVIDRTGAVHNDKWLNKANSNRHTSGQVPAITPDGKSILVNCDDPRWDTGELTHINDGTTTDIIVATGESIKVAMTDPRWETGELVGIGKGSAPVIEVSTGKKFKALLDDPRWKTGEIVSIFKGLASAKIVETGQAIQVPTDDPRWATGEIVGITKGMTVAINTKTGDKIQVSRDDPRWKTGEIKSHRSGKASAIIVLTGEKIFVPITDPRWTSGEIIGVNKGLKHKKNRKDANIILT